MRLIAGLLVIPPAERPGARVWLLAQRADESIPVRATSLTSMSVNVAGVGLRSASSPSSGSGLVLLFAIYPSERMDAATMSPRRVLRAHDRAAARLRFIPGAMRQPSRGGTGACLCGGRGSSG